MHELEQIAIELHDCAREVEASALVRLGERLRQIADEISDEDQKVSLLQTALNQLEVIPLWASRLDCHT